MILCVCLNPAIDVTYQVDRLDVGRSHRVGRVSARAGGKAVNVARGLQALGAPVELLVPLGGPTGEEVGRDLEQAGLVVHALTGGATRRTVTVVDDAGTATAFNEAGPPVVAAERRTWAEQLGRLAGDAAVVVLSGSVPPGITPRQYGELVALARRGGAEVIVDCSGDHLLAALEGGPAIVKPNATELADVTGTTEVTESFGDSGGSRVLTAARSLQARSPLCAVVASRGPDGLLGAAGEGAWQARLPRPLVGNPTGAGDAVVASLAADLWQALGSGWTLRWPDVLRRAVALSATAVLQPVAGAVDVALARRLADEVQVEPLLGDP